ncbi:MULTISPECIES: glycoside hydrolase family 15 protein [unclassified Mycolicibacterium]|uniref:glycoside hydrolase family 15 protein n=1 Tax=unclassified Mycolicibacterium TaxID=2636767 RepID=UPI002EDB1A07
MSGGIAEPHVLREYALLADGHRGALIGPRGEIGWMCAPRWDSDAVFADLIGGNGAFAITPRGRFVWGGHYEDGSLTWRSRWVTTDGITECREALAYPGDPHRAVLLRRLIAVHGDACATMTFAPAAGFGRHGMTDLIRDDRGVWHAECGPLHITLRGAAHATPAYDEAGVLALCCDLKLGEGGHHDIVVEVADRIGCGPLPDPDALWLRTERSWESGFPTFDASITALDARHSYAVLRGMTAPGGGMVAAATMSLPERAEQGRNYDYRYVWIRDQCYAGQAVALDGPHPLLDDAIAFVTDRLLADGPDLKPAYRVDGTAVPDERSLNLPGYPGGTDVLGNHAHSQFQLDVFGEALLLFAAAARHDHLDGDGYRAAAAAAAALADRWQEPDAGVWELEPRRWAHSRLTCVAGLRAIATRAPTRDAAEFKLLADTILAASADCVHPSGRWQRAPDDSRVDAALLVPALRGAVPHDDPRTVATLRAVLDELEVDGFVYRFHHEGQPLADAEGAFLLCGFWTALACWQQGDMVGATRFFERNRAACGPPGLFCEEYDVEQRQLRGNIPQAFVHALFIESSLRVAKSPHTDSPPTENREEPS